MARPLLPLVCIACLASLAGGCAGTDPRPRHLPVPGWGEHVAVTPRIVRRGGGAFDVHVRLAGPKMPPREKPPRVEVTLADHRGKPIRPRGPVECEGGVGDVRYTTLNYTASFGPADAGVALGRLSPGRVTVLLEGSGATWRVAAAGPAEGD